MKGKTHDSYFQFPLTLLAYAAPDDLWSMIVDWCLVDRSAALVAGKTLDDQAAYFEALALSKKPGDLDEESREHYGMMLAAKELRVGLGSVIRTRNSAALIQAVLQKYEEEAGPSMLVRMRADLVWRLKARLGSYREFCVLAGLYAGIGDSRYRSVSLKWLRYLAAGYKNAAAHAALNPGVATDDAPDGLLSVGQLRRTLRKLEDEGWFVSYYDGRRRYYSHRMKHEDLAAAVLKRKTIRVERAIQRKRAKLQGLQQLEVLRAEASLFDSAIADAMARLSMKGLPPAAASGMVARGPEGHRKGDANATPTIESSSIEGTSTESSSSIKASAHIKAAAAAALYEKKGKAKIGSAGDTPVAGASAYEQGEYVWTPAGLGVVQRAYPDKLFALIEGTTDVLGFGYAEIKKLDEARAEVQA